MDDKKENVNKVLIKLADMCMANQTDTRQLSLLVQELNEGLTQLNFLTLEVSKNTYKTLDALTKRIIDLELMVGIPTIEDSSLLVEEDDSDKD